MHIIEITDDKVTHLADTIGKMLHYGGKAMECIEEMRVGDRERGYGRYGMRDDDMRPEDYDRMGERYPRERWEEWPPYMGERRGRSSSTGRYVRR